MAEHITPIRTYLLVFLALMVLTAVTVWAAFIDLGPLNDLVAMAIACSKATLVVLWFMHVKGSSRMSKLTVVAGFFWLAILIGITLSDYFSRGLVAPPKAPQETVSLG